MLISPSSSTLHTALSLSLSPPPFLSTQRGRFHCRSLHPSQPTRARFRQTGRQTEAETETWQTAKKKEFIISVLIAFFILSKIFSASRSHKPSLSNFLNPPVISHGVGILHVQATSFTNKQLFARNSIMPFNNRRAIGANIFNTNYHKRMLQAASKCFRENFETL